MSIYQSEIQMFYGGLDPDFRLIPAPSLSVSIQPQYSNDTIIGYTYNINLSGSITALDLRNLEIGDEYPNSPTYGIGSIIDHVYKLRQILSQNGSILYLINKSDDSNILKAKGGILRSFNIEDSPNSWNHFVNYSATLEFSAIDFMEYTEDCGSVFMDSGSFPDSQPGIVDLNKFKIKSFNDNWTVSFDETESYNRIQNIETGTNLNINNSSFTIEYKINAVGKHFFVYDEADEASLLPAWEQAKNFVQYRLYYQVTNLINNVLKNNYNTCSSSDGLNDILIPGSGSNNGLLSSLGDSRYAVYNEEIVCEASESDGSFSATYKAIVKNKLSNNLFTANNVKHKINKKTTFNRDAKGIITNNISINGTIEGLIEGGLVRIPGPVELPANGSFLIKGSASSTKYLNAKLVLDQIYSPNDYNNGIGSSGKRDLKVFFKNALGITLIALNSTQPIDDIIPDPPHPASFNLTHDYNAGTINYSVEYNSNRSCGRKYSDISIQISNPTKIIASFNIPNGESCPVIQELGTYSAKKVSVTIQGVDLSETGKPTNINISSLIACSDCDSIGYFPIPLPDNSYILTERKISSNPVDGSFTVNLGYICNDSCEI
jgi:hypothetical protein